MAIKEQKIGFKSSKGLHNCTITSLSLEVGEVKLQGLRVLLKMDFVAVGASVFHEHILFPKKTIVPSITNSKVRYR